MRTNRPWTITIVNAISSADTLGSPTSIDQVHKLARNYIASLDLGCPNLRMVNEVDRGVFIEKMPGKDRYLQWVKVWKDFYRGLSMLIRNAKKAFGRQDYRVQRLKETAQVMLNARHNAKLASWAIKMQAKRLNAA